MILATYIPFYRIHEVLLFFAKNCEIISPRECWVFVDNVYHEKQKELLRKIFPDSYWVFTGNWRNRTETWLEMIRHASATGEECVVVDSDNLLEDSFKEIYSALKDAPLYTLMNIEAWSNEEARATYLRRSRKIGEISVRGETRPLLLYKVYEGPGASIFRGGSPFFIGPKQVVVFRKYPGEEILRGIERAIREVDPWLRNFINDETPLGIIAYLMGIKEVYWTFGSYHLYHGSTPSRQTPFLVALAHVQFANGLAKVFRKKEFTYYGLKYRLAFWKNFLNLLSV